MQFGLCRRLMSCVAALTCFDLRGGVVMDFCDGCCAYGCCVCVCCGGGANSCDGAVADFCDGMAILCDEMAIFCEGYLLVALSGYLL